MEKIDRIVVLFMLACYASVYLIAIYAENIIWIAIFSESF